MRTSLQNEQVHNMSTSLQNEKVKFLDVEFHVTFKNHKTAERRGKNERHFFSGVGRKSIFV